MAMSKPAGNAWLIQTTLAASGCAPIHLNRSHITRCPLGARSGQTATRSRRAAHAPAPRARPSRCYAFLRGPAADALAVRRWAGMGVMAKVAANAGLSPGLAVLSQKFAEMFYVAMTVFTSCAPCRAEARAPPRG